MTFLLLFIFLKYTVLKNQKKSILAFVDFSKTLPQSTSSVSDLQTQAFAYINKFFQIVFKFSKSFLDFLTLSMT